MDMNYERGYKTYCFYNSNSVVVFLVMDKCIKTSDSESVKSNVKLHNFILAIQTVDKFVGMYRLWVSFT